MSGHERNAELSRLRDEIARRGAGWSGSATAAVPAQLPAQLPARVLVRDLDEVARELGGWPDGALVGVSGRGRTRMALAAARGHAPVAWIDLDGAFFPPGAARLGVAIDRLLWIHPHDVGEALWAVHVLLAGGTFERVVLDLPSEAPRDRRIERALLRLERDAEASGATAVLLAPTPLPGVTLALAVEPRPEGLHIDWHRRRGAGRRQGDMLLCERGRLPPS